MSRLTSVLRRVWPKLRPWAPFAIVAALLYFLVAAVNPVTLITSARTFNWLYLLPLAGCYLLYVGLRSARWHFLMKPLDAPNSMTDSLLLFFAAQSAVLVPAGQFLLPVLQKCQHGTLIRRSAATVLVQEVVFSVLILPAALPGVFPGYQVGGWLLLAGFVIAVGAGALVLHEGVSKITFFVLSHLPFAKHHAPGLRDLRRHVVLVVNTPEAILGSIFDLAAIAAAGTGFYIALVGLGQGHVGWVGAIATYAFGNAVANLSALPGGLGANEDASTVLLGHMGLAAGPAAAVTIIFRALTLVFGTLLGLGVLLLFRRRFKVQAGLGSMIAAAKAGSRHVETGQEPLLPAVDPATGPLREPSA